MRLGRLVTGIVQALAEIQAQLPVVRKAQTAKVPTKTGGQYSYTYADLADVARAVYPLLGKVGLAFICSPQFVADRYVLVGSLEHVGGDVRGGSYPLPDRGSAQEIGSAISYGRRYLLGCLSGVITDDDDDGAAASAARPAAAKRPPAAAAAEPISAGLLKALHASMGGRGITDRDEGLAYLGDVVGRTLASSKDLTAAEARKAIDMLKSGEVP
jgi:hypothetical protein